MLDERQDVRIETDGPRVECGVFGLYLHPSLANSEIVELILEGSLQNQHRGEESEGLCISDGCSVSLPLKCMGQVKDLYNIYLRDHKPRGGIFGHIGIGHNRYSSTGSSTIENAAPFRFDTDQGAVAVAHNGNITNAAELKAELISKGVTFVSTTDSEIIGALIANSDKNSWFEKISDALSRLEGSFSLVISTKNTLFAARDKFGIRPLSIGEFEMEGERCYAVSSETAGFSKFSVSSVGDVAPGELLEISSNGIQSTSFAEESDGAFCGLEFAYLMRPDSRFEGVQMDTIRRSFGRVLAINYPVPDTTDLVTYIPESARPAAEGYAAQISIMQGRYVPYVTSMIKGRYGTINGTHRGFINPKQSERKKVAEENYYAFDVIKGKEICLIEDSVVGGTTTLGVIEMCKTRIGLLKNEGVSKVHLRVVFPQVKGSCPYGVDIDDNRFLVAKEFHQNIDEIAKFIGADSLGYLVPSEFSSVIDETVGKRVGLCMGCVTGKYPYGQVKANKLIFENEIE